MVKQEGATWEESLAQSDKGVSFSENTIGRILLVTAFLPIPISFALLWYFIRPSEMPLVLHYNVYFGVDLLGTWWQAYILPLLGVLFYGGHVFLARRFYMRAERIACYLMLLSAGMLSCGILIASMSTAFINY